MHENRLIIDEKYIAMTIWKTGKEENIIH